MLWSPIEKIADADGAEGDAIGVGDPDGVAEADGDGLAEAEGDTEGDELADADGDGLAAVSRCAPAACPEPPEADGLGFALAFGLEFAFGELLAFGEEFALGDGLEFGVGIELGSGFGTVVGPLEGSPAPSFLSPGAHWTPPGTGEVQSSTCLNLS